MPQKSQRPSLTYLNFKGSLLTRGFWLYIWEIRQANKTPVHYVGRTGDVSSQNPQSPFNRISQHLGTNDRNNTLRKHLVRQLISAEKCSFRLVAYGPLLVTKAPKEYYERRDIIAALEKALCDAMRDAKYMVINTVQCNKKPQPNRFHHIRAAFAEAFPKLRKN